MDRVHYQFRLDHFPGLFDDHRQINFNIVRTILEYYFCGSPTKRNEMKTLRQLLLYHFVPYRIVSYHIV